MLASRDDAKLRKSVVALAGSTAVGAGLILAAAFAGGTLRLTLWGLALVLDAAGPYLFGAEGWKLVPGHFAERHGAIVIIALGESIVAIGVGARQKIDGGIAVGALLGMAVAAALWWAYFDVTAIIAGRQLAGAEVGREQNEIARDSYSYLHFPLVAGIALLAVGLKLTLAHVEHPLKLVPAVALLGGTALYLLGHVAFRLRNIGTVSVRRLVCALALVALVPLAGQVSALALLAVMTLVLVAMIVYEVLRYADFRDRVRHLDVDRDPAG